LEKVRGASFALQAKRSTALNAIARPRRFRRNQSDSTLFAWYPTHLAGYPMATAATYRDQANVFFRMALVCSDWEQAAQLEAQGRMFLNMARQLPDPSRDPNSLLEGLRIQQPSKT
jgi:hypothetical protein